jgi:hypothetical protein
MEIVKLKNRLDNNESDRAISLGFLPTCKMTDRSDIKIINNSDLHDVHFYKPFYIVTNDDHTNEYVFSMLNFRCVENKLFMYEIKNNKKSLLHVFDLKSIDTYESLCDNIKINPSWSKLIIPSGNNIIIYNLRAILNGRLMGEEIKMSEFDRDNSNDEEEQNNHVAMDKTTEITATDAVTNYKNAIKDINKIWDRYDTYIFDDRINRIYYYGTKIIIIESLKIEDDNECNRERHIFTFFRNPLHALTFSNNGLYALCRDHRKNRIIIFNLTSSTKDDRIILTSKTFTGSDWLISNDGKVLINKLVDTLRVIIIDGKSMNVITHDISHMSNEDTTIMLRTIEILSDNSVSTYLLIIWDRFNSNFQFYGITSGNVSHISHKFNIRYKIPKNVKKISTNGDIIIYKYDKKTMMQDISSIIKLPIIYLKCVELKNILITNCKLTLSSEIIIGNMTTRKRLYLTNDLHAILEPLVINNMILADTFENLDIPIIEEDDSYTELDSLDIFFTFIDDISKVGIVFDKLHGDGIALIKIELMMKIFIDIFNSLVFVKVDVNNDFMEDPNYKPGYKESENNHPMSGIAKKYIELCMTYILYMYVANVQEYNHDIYNSMVALLRN